MNNEANMQESKKITEQQTKKEYKTQEKIIH